MQIFLWILAGLGIVFVLIILVIVILAIKTNISERKYKRKHGITKFEKGILELFCR